MGLDAVEIVMEVEAAFDIRIPDEAGQKIETVGQLYDYVVEQTRQKTADPTNDIPARTDVCLTAATFYLLRRQSYADDSGLERWQVGPRESLGGYCLLGVAAAANGPSWLAGWSWNCPCLRPRWGWLRLSALALAFRSAFLAIAVAGYASLVGGGVGAVDCRPLDDRLHANKLRWLIALRPSITTVGDLCSVLLADNYRRLVARFSTRRPSDVFR